LSFEDLYSIAGLARIDAAFASHLGEAESALRARLDAARADPASLGRLGESELLIALAPHVEDFLAELFAIEPEVATLQAAQRELDFLRLIPVEHEQRHGVDMWRMPADHLRRREGFALTDPGTDLAGGLDQANYCIWCHEQQKDSCSSGMPEKKPVEGSTAPFKKSPFGVILAGCP